MRNQLQEMRVNAMAQTLMFKNVAEQTSLLSLNMGQVDDLFPGFAAGDFALIYGSPSIDYLTATLCIRSQIPKDIGGLNSDVLFIDCGNTFNKDQINRTIQRYHLNQKQAISRIHISRACTAYQITSLITEHLKNIVTEFNTKLIIISDITGLFLAEDIPEEEASRVFSQLAAYLQKFARDNKLIIVTTVPRHQNKRRNEALKTTICNKANIAIMLKQSLYESEFELEKHRKFLLGSAEFPSTNGNLTDFF